MPSHYKILELLTGNSYVAYFLQWLCLYRQGHVSSPSIYGTKKKNSNRYYVEIVFFKENEIVTKFLINNNYTDKVTNTYKNFLPVDVQKKHDFNRRPKQLAISLFIFLSSLT